MSETFKNRVDRALNKILETYQQEENAIQERGPVANFSKPTTWQMLIGAIVIGLLAGSVIGYSLGWFKSQGREQQYNTQTTVTR